MNERDLMAVPPGPPHAKLGELIDCFTERHRPGVVYVECGGDDGPWDKYSPEEIETFANELLALAKMAREQR